MTVWELVRAFVRRWPIVLVGALVTAGAGLAALNDDGVYFTRTEILFLAPTSPLYPNALRTQSEDIIIAAGAVARRISGPQAETKFASPDVTLVGLGVREGWWLRLPDTGGQWASNFATQRLFLDIVGPTREGVEAEQAKILGRVADELRQMQEQAGADPAAMITSMEAPETTVIFHVEGSNVRALAMVAVLGVGLTAAVVLVLERRRRSRADAAWAATGTLAAG